jgi:hypothetical protein
VAREVEQASGIDALLVEEEAELGAEAGVALLPFEDRVLLRAAALGEDERLRQREDRPELRHRLVLHEDDDAFLGVLGRRR